LATDVICPVFGRKKWEDIFVRTRTNMEVLGLLQALFVFGLFSIASIRLFKMLLLKAVPQKSSLDFFKSPRRDFIRPFLGALAS